MAPNLRWFADVSEPGLDVGPGLDGGDVVLGPGEPPGLDGKEVMTDDPVTVSPDEDIRRAARTMLDNKIGCLPVLEGDRLVGLLTESDLLRSIAES